MKRRTKEQISEGKRLSQKALDSLRKSNMQPGFDYGRALCELTKIYDREQIANFCDYKTKTPISKMMSGKMIPSHPRGELIYTLYIETFNRKEDYIPKPQPTRKPPIQKIPKVTL